jgi:hypothetical protein
MNATTTTSTTAIPVRVPYPDAAEPRLRHRLGPGVLHVVPSDEPDWITGSYDDRGTGLPLTAEIDGDTATLSQGFSFRSTASVLGLPQLELAISVRRPFALTMEAGASESGFDLGGLPITAFELKAGAGKYDVDFSRPNPVSMRSMELGGGAGAFAARHLANASFGTLHVGTGVAGCILDFSGTLLHDASARIDTGLGSVELVIPATTAARVHAKTFAAGTDAIGGFTRKSDGYYTAPALEGRRPLLVIEASVAFGQLTLRAT